MPNFINNVRRNDQVLRDLEDGSDDIQKPIKGQLIQTKSIPTANPPLIQQESNTTNAIRSVSVPQPKGVIIKSEDKYAFDRKVSGIKVIKPLDQSSEDINPED